MTMAVLIIFPVILQTVINLIMLSIGGQGEGVSDKLKIEINCIDLWLWWSLATVNWNLTTIRLVSLWTSVGFSLRS